VIYADIGVKDDESYLNHTWSNHTWSYLYCIRLSCLNQDRGFFQVPKSFNFQVAAPDWNDVSESCGLLDGARTSFRWHVAAEKIDYRHLSTLSIVSTDIEQKHTKHISLSKWWAEAHHCHHVSSDPLHLRKFADLWPTASLFEYQETRLGRDHLDFNRTSCESISVLKLSLIENHRILGVMEWIWQNILLLKDSESIG
jgi:hypothetical protein